MRVNPKHRKVEHWDDERNLDNGIIITLKYGWSFEPDEHCGVKGFDTITGALLAISESTECKCEECINANK